MSRPLSRRPSGPSLISRAARTTLTPIPETSVLPRRAASLSSTSTPSVGGTTSTTTSDSGQKAQRTTKVSHKLVVLPSEPQTKPLPGQLLDGEPERDDDGESILVTGMGTKDKKSDGERMTKLERKKAGFKRLTAYCVAEGLRMKLLAAFLKREHNVAPRVYDEALYAMYHLPLLPGYDPNVNVRSSTAAKTVGGVSIASQFFEAEENGYEGTYFTADDPSETLISSDGFIPSLSPEDARNLFSNPLTLAAPLGISPIAESPEARLLRANHVLKAKAIAAAEDNVAEIIFFSYGVVVFFGLQETQERAVLEDIENADVFSRKIDEDAWEVEECHYAYDPNAAYPRIYNDLFTFKSPSHLLKLSIAHALAQSTLLAHYESLAQLVLSDPRTVSIPRQLAMTGELRLRRRDALKLTGRLFRLRRDVNLVSNVLDVPELFWSEASLRGLYDAVREYLEIEGRCVVLNERLAVTSDLLDLIHGHLNNSAMERITWIIIWLIVVACLVELGEVIARLIVNATLGTRRAHIPVLPNIFRFASGARSGSVQSGGMQGVHPAMRVSREEAVGVLEKMMRMGETG